MLTKQQQAAIGKFARQRVAALFMEMGTGKTRTAVELANLHADKYDLAVWLAPFSTIENARAEIQKSGGFSRPVVYRGYESIASSDRIYLDLMDELAGKRVFLVCDESLFLKNGETKRWQRCNRIRKEFADFCVLLNGTPMSRDEMDIYWQMEFMSPLIFDLPENQFRSRMFTKVTRYDGKRKDIYYKRCSKNLPWLKSAIEPYVYECDLSLDCEIEELEARYRLSDKIDEDYQLAKKDFLDAVKNYDDIKILGALTNMKYIVACDRLKNDTIAKEIMDKKCLVFCEYREEIDRIEKSTKNGVFKITGDTSMTERATIIKEWGNVQKPLLIMLGCGAFGLNLQSCDDVRFASVPWDYAKYEQAIHRVIRIGQKSQIVHVKKYLQRVGISNLVEECLWRKTTMAKLVKEMDWRNCGI